MVLENAPEMMIAPTSRRAHRAPHVHALAQHNPQEACDVRRRL
jgi:hypothetical protein